MSETKNPGEKKLSVSKLTLKPRTEAGVVRQSFSHGRSKQVVVEKVKRRSIGAAPEAKAEAAPVETARKPAAAKAAPAPAEAPKPSGVVLRTLTEEERVARAHALADSRVREAEERKIAEEEARRRQSREVVDKTEREAAETRKREEEDRRKHDEETKRKAGEVAKKRLGEDEVKRPGPGRMTLEAEDDDGPPKSRRPGAARPATARPAAPRGAPAKERGRLTLVTALRADEVRERSVASFRRRTQRLKGQASAEPKEKLVREVTIPEAITISDLANRMSERAVDVIRLLMQQGQMLQINDVIDADTAQLIAEEMGHSGAPRVGIRRRGRPVRRGRRARPSRAARAGGHRHGPRRPRQDLAAGRHPLDQRGGGRSRRHHPAHRRLSSHRAVRRQDHLHRHARPCRLHGDARARRQGHRHRRAGGRRRRRRHAADGGSHQSRQGGEGADHCRHQQDRQTGRQAGTRAHRPAAA